MQTTLLPQLKELNHFSLKQFSEKLNFIRIFSLRAISNHSQELIILSPLFILKRITYRANIYANNFRIDLDQLAPVLLHNER